MRLSDAFQHELEPLQRSFEPENESSEDSGLEPGRQVFYATATGALYLSHALTTWQARTYEFAAILFTAAAFPNTLLMNSLRGLTNNIAVLLLSSAIGTAVDNASNELRLFLLSISINRASVVISCIGWMLLLHASQDSTTTIEPFRILIFVFVVFVGIAERVSGVANTIVSERKWTPALASGSESGSLTDLNAQMRRIDLTCKLFAPLIIAGIISISSTTTGVLAIAASSLLTWGIEILSARFVWSRGVAFHQHSNQARRGARDGSFTGHLDLLTVVLKIAETQIANVRAYFRARVWVPSFALSLLHLSVLSYSATLITYLLNTGISLPVITVARTLGSIVEISSTYLAPLGIRFLARVKALETYRRIPSEVSEGEQEPINGDKTVGLERTGLWGICLQSISLVPVVLAIGQISMSNNAEPYQQGFNKAEDVSKSVVNLSTVPMFVFLSLSRLGLWIFDLTTQELTQTGVKSEERSSFAGTEMAFVSLFELVQWIAAAAWPSPDQFHWLASGSLMAVVGSTTLYAVWVRYRRGHLIHPEKLGCGCLKKNGYMPELS